MCSWQIHTNPWTLFNSTNRLISTSHPDLWGVTACTPGNFGADLGPNAKSTHGQTKKAGFRIKQLSFEQWLKTENGISSTIHSSAVIKPVEQHLDRLWTSDSLLQTISIFFWMPQRCEGVIKLSVEIKLCQISTKAPETPRPRLVENPWKPTVYLSLLKGLSFYIHKLQGFPSRMQSDLSDWFENLWSFFGTGIQDCNLNIKQWKNQSRRTCVQWCGFLNEVSTMRKWLNLTILTIHEAPCSHMASSKLPSR